MAELPPVHVVFSSESVFDVVPSPVGSAVLQASFTSRQIFGMYGSTPPPTARLLQAHAGVFQPALVKKACIAIGLCRTHKTRDCDREDARILSSLADFTGGRSGYSTQSTDPSSSCRASPRKASISVFRSGGREGRLHSASVIIALFVTTNRSHSKRRRRLFRICRQAVAPGGHNSAPSAGLC
jgi:hypothetical protein